MNSTPVSKTTSKSASGKFIDPDTLSFHSESSWAAAKRAARDELSFCDSAAEVPRKKRRKIKELSSSEGQRRAKRQKRRRIRRYFRALSDSESDEGHKEASRKWYEEVQSTLTDPEGPWPAIKRSFQIDLEESSSDSQFEANLAAKRKKHEAMTKEELAAESSGSLESYLRGVDIASRATYSRTTNKFLKSIPEYRFAFPNESLRQRGRRKRRWHKWVNTRQLKQRKWDKQQDQEQVEVPVPTVITVTSRQRDAKSGRRVDSNSAKSSLESPAAKIGDEASEPAAVDPRLYTPSTITASESGDITREIVNESFTPSTAARVAADADADAQAVTINASATASATADSDNQNSSRRSLSLAFDHSTGATAESALAAFAQATTTTSPKAHAPRPAADSANPTSSRRSLGLVFDLPTGAAADFAVTPFAGATTTTLPEAHVPRPATSRVDHPILQVDLSQIIGGENGRPAANRVDHPILRVDMSQFIGGTNGMRLLQGLQMMSFAASLNRNPATVQVFLNNDSTDTTSPGGAFFAGRIGDGRQDPTTNQPIVHRATDVARNAIALLDLEAPQETEGAVNSNANVSEQEAEAEGIVADTSFENQQHD